MLSITITPNYLFFEELTDKLKQEIEAKHDFKIIYVKNKWAIIGQPDELYKVLYLLSCDYDIELG